MNRILIAIPFVLGLSACDAKDEAEPQDRQAEQAEPDQAQPTVKGHRRGGRGFKGGHRSPEERAQWMMDTLDSDGDGALSPAEVENHPHLSQNFATADADSDGKLSSEELTTFKAEHRTWKHRGPQAGPRTADDAQP